jgi:hypothetical protein
VSGQLNKAQAEALADLSNKWGVASRTVMPWGVIEVVLDDGEKWLIGTDGEAVPENDDWDEDDDDWDDRETWLIGADEAVLENDDWDEDEDGRDEREDESEDEDEDDDDFWDEDENDDEISTAAAAALGACFGGALITIVLAILIEALTDRTMTTSANATVFMLVGAPLGAYWAVKDE